MNIVLLGHPGCGKGTQAKLLEKKYSIQHISTGEMFRATSRESTPLGRKIRKLIDEGRFVPDDVTIEAVRERLSKGDCKNGFILDGFPRNEAQAKELDKITGIDRAIHIHIEDSTVLKRLSERWQCRKCNAIYGMEHMPKKNRLCDNCGTELYQREDDKPEKILKRIDIYHRETKPLVDYYKKKGIFATIDGDKSIKEVFEDICKALGKKVRECQISKNQEELKKAG